MSKISLCYYYPWETKEFRWTYARWSMIGEQLLLAMRARRSHCALSIPAIYSASTTGASADIAAATGMLHGFSCGNRRSSSWPRDRGALLWFGLLEQGIEKQGSCGFVGKGGREKREGKEESNGVEAWRKQGMSPEDSNVIGGEDLR